MAATAAGFIDWVLQRVHAAMREPFGRRAGAA